ncbi:MAG: hypothetical protein JO075_10720, partial [Acidimicrobiia bacterium]|nr:hypothetical protein [Acidimicrobiia bacterium]
MNEVQIIPAVASPTIDQFCRNPFRVLRLPLNCTTEEVVWAAEALSAQTVAGMADAASDPLPWLALPDNVLIWESVSCLEEPLRRLVEEQFWFDFRSDPHGELLCAALVT